MSFSHVEKSQHTLLHMFVLPAYLLDGITVVNRLCPEGANQDQANAPGDGEDRALAADWHPKQQPPQRVDDRREGPKLREPGDGTRREP